MVEKAAAEVFGEDPAYRLWSSRSHTAMVLGLIGVLCLLGALVLKLWPHPAAKELSTAAAPMPAVVASAPAADASSPAAEASAAVVVAAAAVPTAARASAPSQSPIEDMGTLLSTAAPEIAPAWRDLGRLWSLDVVSGDPCQIAAARGLQCYRTLEMTIPLLRQLDRPGVLALQKGSEPAVFAALTGLSEQTATLNVGGQVHRVTLISLARFWRGDYATYWKPPAGFSMGLRDGDTSSVYGQLSQQLAQLEGRPTSAESAVARTLDAGLVARVKAFQKGQGIKADGHPGPMTWMQIDKSLGASGPSLEAGAR
jgi:general secretion pathway protein A